MSLKPEILDAMQFLQDHHLVRLDNNQYRSTRRWQGAMARASSRLVRDKESKNDIRLPISVALMDIFHDELSKPDLVPLIAAMMVVQSNEWAMLNINPQITFQQLYR